MRLTVLGGCGAWPAAGQACGGFLVEHDGFRLLVEAGYATLPRLLAHGPGMLDAAYEPRPLAPGDAFHIGPFTVETLPLPHWLPNAGLRLAAGGRTLAYTGDTGASPAVVALARGADLLVADAGMTAHLP